MSWSPIHRRSTQERLSQDFVPTHTPDRPSMAIPYEAIPSEEECRRIFEAPKDNVDSMAQNPHIASCVKSPKTRQTRQNTERPALSLVIPNHQQHVTQPTAKRGCKSTTDWTPKKERYMQKLNAGSPLRSAPAQGLPTASPAPKVQRSATGDLARQRQERKLQSVSLATPKSPRSNSTPKSVLWHVRRASTPRTPSTLRSAASADANASKSPKIKSSHIRSVSTPRTAKRISSLWAGLGSRPVFRRSSTPADRKPLISSPIETSCRLCHRLSTASGRLCAGCEGDFSVPSVVLPEFAPRGPLEDIPGESVYEMHRRAALPPLPLAKPDRQLVALPEEDEEPASRRTSQETLVMLDTVGMKDVYNEAWLEYYFEESNFRQRGVPMWERSVVYPAWI